MNSDTTSPKVTFVVPCFKLAHLLGECIGSILRQTYGNFEVLIMDDCSPDDTESVARAFTDPRVRYIKNESNLGHLRNYNRGIELARGKYVWLISADDCLKQPYVLSRYMDVMDRHRRVGYIFSPVIALQDGREQGVMQWTVYRDKDAILSGHRFLKDIMNGNFVSAPTGMVRKICYETVSLFPLDLPHAGDWYLWCLFAMHFDVAFLSEPMIHYRRHGENISLAHRKVDDRIVRNDLVLARWKLRVKASEAGDTAAVRQCDYILGQKYANEIARTIYDQDPVGPTVEDFEKALAANVAVVREQRRIRAIMYGALGDQAFGAGKLDDAIRNYATSLEQDSAQPLIRMKRLLIRKGKFGNLVRRGLRALRGS